MALASDQGWPGGLLIEFGPDRRRPGEIQMPRTIHQGWSGEIFTAVATDRGCRETFVTAFGTDLDCPGDVKTRF